MASTDLSKASAAGEPSDIETCADVLTRTRGSDVITDDNMGEEWRYGFVGELPTRR